MNAALSMAILMFAAAGASVADSSNGTSADQHWSFTLHRGPCFGECPVYVLHIAEDGLVTFTGKEFTATQGTVTSHISAPELRDLISTVRAQSFFDLPDDLDKGCPVLASDRTGTTVTVAENGAVKRVSVQECVTLSEQQFDTELGSIPTDKPSGGHGAPQNVTLRATLARYHDWGLRLHTVANKIDDVANAYKWIEQQ